MSYKSYESQVKKAKNARDLHNILQKIEKDRSLLSKEKYVLRKEVYYRVAELGLDKEFYRVLVEEELKELRGNLTDTLYDAVEGYLLSFVLEHYQSWDGRKKNLRYVTAFLRYLIKKRGRKIDVTDLERKNLRDLLDRFIFDYTESDSHRRAMSSYMKQFGRYLVRNLYVDSFPEPTKIVIQKPPPEVREKRQKGRVRKLQELDLIFNKVGYRVEGAERKKAMALFFKFSLQSGTRPSQALLMTVEPLTEEGGAEWVNDVWGRPFVKVPYFEAVEAEKKRRGFKIIKKVPAGYIYLSQKLYKEMWDFIEDEDLDTSDLLFMKYITLSSVERHCRTLANLVGVADFSPYDFRHTWASVLYNASGYNESLVIQMGSWSGESIPFNHYIKNMDSRMAVDIAKKYEIYLPPEPDVLRSVREVEAGERPEVRSLLERIKELEEKLKKLEFGE